jgi:hypothetical protein
VTTLIFELRSIERFIAYRIFDLLIKGINVSFGNSAVPKESESIECAHELHIYAREALLGLPTIKTTEEMRLKI